MLGQLLSDQKGNTTTATAYLQESLSVLQRIGLPDDPTVQSILNRFLGQQGND